jgi:crotonobetainyl-CoA:carnitine CoA-transferase CaiB-like acyl-CoA transferase
MPSDLAGLLVVSVEQAVAAPYLSGRLAEAGARVIKVERPEGDFARGYDHLVHGESAYFVWLNRGKESICLDLREENDKTLLSSLIARADIFIQNLAPGDRPPRFRARQVARGEPAPHHRVHFRLWR